MQVKSKNGLKVVIIAIALLLCLALAIGITGAFYQAKRQATGTLSMDQGIIIDYKGFGKTPDEGIWTRETTTTFLLFDETNAQPGQNIPVNAAGIRANEKSVNFYARVKLSYKFYNNGTEVTTLPNASDLITTSANFFGTNWVESGDGYFYYAADTTLNKFNKDTQTFVDLFATDAKFIIEGAGFTGATSDGEGGGFKIDETTSINKIEVYLTLETLQGDADAAAEGWKITIPNLENFSENKLLNANGDVLDPKITELVENTTYQVVDESGNGYKFTYKLDETNMTATITGPAGSPTTLNIPSKIRVNKKDYTIISIGESAFSKCTSLTSITIPDSVTSIESKAFSECESLTSIIIPESVTSINKQTYSRCYSLSSITIPSSVTSIVAYAFEYCSSLTSVTIPNSATSIGHRAFQGCTGLAEIYNLSSLDIKKGADSNGSVGYYAKVIHTNADESTKIVKDNGIAYYVDENVKIALTLLDKTSTSAKISNDCMEINQNAFYKCALTSIIIPASVISIRDSAFTACKNLSTISFGDNSKLTSIGASTFSGCSALTSITIPDSVTTIGTYAFSRCTGLTTINFGNSSKLNDIERCAFQNCAALTSITIPNDVTILREYIFSECTSLTSITIPNSVTSIYSYAFSGCTSLSSITIPNSVTDISHGVFSGCIELKTIKVESGNTKYHVSGNCLIETVSKTLIAGYNNSVIPTDGSVTNIAESAFAGYTSLRTIAIPDNVTSIGWSSFKGCINLTTIIFGENSKLTSIGKYAFNGCSGLTSITIPDSVTSIGESAFYFCKGLTIKISDIGGTWVKASGNTPVDPSTLLKDINYDIKRA